MYGMIFESNNSSKIITIFQILSLASHIFFHLTEKNISNIWVVSCIKNFNT